MADLKKYQDQLIGVAKSKYRNEESLSDRVITAFYEVPRHKFVSRYRNYGTEEWMDINSENLDQHLGTVYSDHPLCLKGTDEEFRAKKGTAQVSTISQPSFVLRLIDLLDLENGQTVFELGTASGWNSALMANMVGDEGRVFTTEIITELADTAKKTIQNLGITNIDVISGDAADGYPDGAPFDRVMFTAGAFDLPSVFYKQIKVGGKLLFVLKNKGGTDNLLLLEKHKDHFEAIYSSPCGFVPMTGKNHIPSMEGKYLTDFLSEKRIESVPVKERSFWWGAGSKQHFMWHTSAIRSFLSLFEQFEAIHEDGDEEGTFGWYDSQSSSFAHATKDKLFSYGGERAAEQFVAKLKHWVEIGMPTLSNLQLKVFPANTSVNSNANSWISKRNQSTFVWSMPG